MAKDSEPKTFIVFSPGSTNKESQKNGASTQKHKPVHLKKSGKPSYIVREGNQLFSVEITDPWAAPALHVETMPKDPTWVMRKIFAWIAYPNLTKKGANDRLQVEKMLGAWTWRTLNFQGRVRKKDMPSWTKTIPSKRVITNCERIQKRLLKRFTAVEMLDDLAMGALGHGKVDGSDFLMAFAGRGVADLPGKTPSVLSLSERLDDVWHEDGDSQVGNIRNRIWQQTRTVLHLAKATVYYAGDKNRDFTSLVGKPDWVFDVLEEAEKYRLRYLPLLTYSIPPEKTIKFIPE